ncbi:MAG: class I SAM-dependent methyltransferase [Geminocystis sp.]|nr:class I SAM-dependent methyltransferase [Geminocystis sp.]HIK38414.1 class I SAM-dependent methyltransferase [Geminocystis sp. M7585_C2015_104]MCS7147759.1 class I SAM-dependent methyltransferase [Geminocystis sp.]MCX8079221.1 class I SAM-dependent methyltransferase [Geminocystis sp.]MDW8116667.1 class I SAM-dependent methyltransferase [Geminocystis sp.]
MSEVTEAVRRLYNTYPFPPDPLLDEPPAGYNWRWHYQAAYNFCTGIKPKKREKIRILDAGCGTGSGTEYLILHNPKADIVAIDISEKALEIAQRRLEKSGILKEFQGSIIFKQLPVESVSQLEGEFDFINCVGVLHHLPQPEVGLKALASKLAPGGIFHIFVYGELGRWEIRLMQQAIALLNDKKDDYKEGVRIGRKIFAALPENNRLVRRERERWAWENQRDECFADMYVHPQEIDFNINTLFDFINSSGLEFVGFSNPQVWQLERLLGKDEELMKKAYSLTEKERYRLIELLDPETITHYEFFLAKPPLPRYDWQDDDLLAKAIPQLNPCMFGWESKNLLDYQFQPVTLDDNEFAFMKLCSLNPDKQFTVRDILSRVSLNLSQVRSLVKRQLVMLSLP